MLRVVSYTYFRIVYVVWFASSCSVRKIPMVDCEIVIILNRTTYVRVNCTKQGCVE